MAPGRRGKVMVSPEARKMLARMFAQRRPEDETIYDVRRDWEATAARQPLPKGVRVDAATSDGVPGEWVEMPFSDPSRAILLLHGGGFTAGSPRTHRRLAAFLGRATKTPVLVPDYRLAPEHPFPAALKDALIVFRWLTRTAGYRAEDVVVAGDSAGGGLALAMMLALRSANAPQPRAAVLLSPWTDLTISGTSHITRAKRDPKVTGAALRQAARYYAGERNLREPLISPHFADFEQLPAMLIHVGDEEVLLDDSRGLAERARASGVAVSLRQWSGMWHVFHETGPDLPEAAEALSEIGSYVQQQFSGGSAVAAT